MVTITHAKNVAIADDPKAAAAGEVLPSDWNAAHVVTGIRTTLTADANYYVSTTGSDITGDGSQGNPWKTLPHAAATIVDSIDGGGFRVTVNISAGTYVGVDGWFVPPNCKNYSITGVSTDQTLVVIQDSGDGQCLGFGQGAVAIHVGNLTIDANNSGTNGIEVGHNNVLFITAANGTGDVNFEASGGGGGFCLFNNVDSAQMINASDITITGTWEGVWYLGNVSSYASPVGNVIFSGTPTWTMGYIDAFGGQYEMDGNFVGTSSGPGLSIFRGEPVINFNVPNNIPGSSMGNFASGLLNYYDGTSAINATIISAYTIAGAPSTTRLSAGSAAVFKDTTKATGLGVSLVYNDAGTLVSVNLTT